MITGTSLRSAACSLRVITTAAEPSVSWQQSKSRMQGSAIQRESWCASRVIGRWKPQAAGFVAAYSRSWTTALPKSALVAPYWCMYRVALSAIQEAGVITPKGMHHCIAVVPEWAEVGLGAIFGAPK